MAQPAGTFSAHDAVGNREDLSNVIFNIEPFETPLISMMKKTKAKATNHEWQTDTLEAPSATNAHVEGDDANPSAPSATTRLGNYTQILKKHVVVTGTQEAVDKAGRKSEVAYQTANRLKEIKTDVEMSMIGANNAKVAGNNTTAREMASLQTYLTSNTSFGATGADATGDGTDARTDGTQRPLTSDLVDEVLQACFANGGQPTTMLVGAFNKGVASGFTGNASRQIDVKGNMNTVMNTVDVYVGDFATLKIVASRHVRSRDALLIDPKYIALADLRSVRQTPLAKTGDSLRKEIVYETTLEVCNEAAHGGVFDLTTS